MIRFKTESERYNNDVAQYAWKSSIVADHNAAIAASGSASLLPEDIEEIINEGMRYGFKDDELTLNHGQYRRIDDTMISEICKWVVKLGDKIKKLNLSGNQLTSTGASLLVNTLKVNQVTIMKIDLGMNLNLNDTCMKSIGEFIRCNNFIEQLNLRSTQISDTGIEMFVPYLNGNETFKYIDFTWNNRITDKSIPFLIKMIESSSIEKIVIKDTSITEQNILSIPLIENAIKHGSSVLNIDSKDINDDNINNICKFMKKYGIDKLQEIIHGYSKVTAKGISILITTLKECNSVVSNLHLSGNQIDDKCVEVFADYVLHNDHLEVLDLKYNKITDKGIKILSDHIIGNTALKELLLNYNSGITDASVPYLVNMIKKSCVTNISLMLTLVNEEKQHEINEVLSIPVEQRELPIKSKTKSAAKKSFIHSC